MNQVQPQSLRPLIVMDNNGEYYSIGMQRPNSPFIKSNRCSSEHYQRERTKIQQNSFSKAGTSRSNDGIRPQKGNHRRQIKKHTTTNNIGETSSGSEFSSTSCDSWLLVAKNKQQQKTGIKKCNSTYEKPGDVRNHEYQRQKYANPYRPEGVDILADLDEQIAELQIQSNAVRQLVERAKLRRKETRSKCLEHLDEIQKKYLFTTHNFELYL